MLLLLLLLLLLCLEQHLSHNPCMKYRTNLGSQTRLGSGSPSCACAHTANCPLYTLRSTLSALHYPRCSVLFFTLSLSLSPSAPQWRLQVRVRRKLNQLNNKKQYTFVTHTRNRHAHTSTHSCTHTHTSTHSHTSTHTLMHIQLLHTVTKARLSGGS